MTKSIGSAKSRATVKRITKCVLAMVTKLTPTYAASKLGLGVNDIRNMRNGTGFSVAMLIKMVNNTWYEPATIIGGKRLVTRTTHHRTTQARLDKRIRKLSWNYPGEDLAKLTGLSVSGAFGLRYANGAHVTLYTVLGFVDAGHPIDELLFGAVRGN